MIRLQVKDPNPTVREWTDKTTGQLRSMRIQTVLAYLANSQGQTDDTYDKVEVILNEKQSPFPAGNYTLTPGCVYLDRNGRLQLSLSNMQPVVQPKVQAAA